MNSLLDTFFFSGSSNITDLRATLDAGGNAGIVAGRTSSTLIDLLDKSEGARVFVDSGAFGDDVSDFASVFDLYRKVCAVLDHQDCYLVMPDVFRDQAASLQLLSRYEDEVREFIAMGCEAIVPLQRGNRSLSEVYEEVVTILGTRDFRVGLPMGSAARHDSDDINAFLLESQLAKVHFLGRSFRPLRKELEYYKTFHDFDASADASMLVNWVSSGKACGDNIQIAHDECIYHVDDTEVMAYLFLNGEMLTDEVLKFISKHYRVTMAMIEEAIKEDRWVETMDEWSYGGFDAPFLAHAIIRDVIHPKREIRYKFLKKKIGSYLNGTIFQRLNRSAQAELDLVA